MSYVGGGTPRLSGLVGPGEVHVYRLDPGCTASDPVCTQCVSASTYATTTQTLRNTIRVDPLTGRGVGSLRGSFRLANANQISPDLQPVTITLARGSSIQFTDTIAPGGFLASAERHRFTYRNPEGSVDGEIRTATFTVSADGLTVRYTIKTNEFSTASFTGAASAGIRIGDTCFVDPGDSCELEQRGFRSQVSCE
jgi:hypothetical protein